MSFDRHQAIKDWESFLNPDKVRFGLIATGVYLVAYELLCQALIDQPKGFFATEYEGFRPLPSEDYRQHVLSLHKMPYFASALWFKHMGALTDADVDRLSDIRAHRNTLAHETPAFLLKAEQEMDRRLLGSIVALVSKIDTWWIREVEVPLNPDFDGTSVDEIMQTETFSGRMWMLDLIVDFVDTDGKKLAQVVAALEALNPKGNRKDLN